MSNTITPSQVSQTWYPQGSIPASTTPSQSAVMEPQDQTDFSSDALAELSNADTPGLDENQNQHQAPSPSEPPYHAPGPQDPDSQPGCLTPPAATS